MADAASPYPFLPTAAQQALLKACLLDGEDARAAYHDWRGRIDIDHIDAASARLLPILAARLKALGLDDRQFGKYRGVQRLAWAQNQMLFNALGPLNAALGEAGIPTMALKGAVLARDYYANVSMRPMVDLDLLVHQPDVRRAAAILQAQGWQPVVAIPQVSEDYAIYHAVTFKNAAVEALEIDLHWRLFAWRFSDEGVASIWANAVPLQLGGTATLAPCATDMMLHICGHGLQWNPLPPVRWISDAAMVVRSGAIDWQRLSEQAARFGLGEPLAIALDYLRDEMRLDIPATAIAGLRAQRSTPIDREIFAMDQIGPDERPFRNYFNLHLHRARSTGGAGPAALFRYFNRMRDGRSVAETLRWLFGRARQAIG